MKEGQIVFYTGEDMMSPLHPTKVEVIGFKHGGETAIIRPLTQEDLDRLDRANGNPEQAVGVEFLEELGVDGEITALQAALLTEEEIIDYSQYKKGDVVEITGTSFMDMLTNGATDGDLGVVLVEENGVLPEHDNIRPEGVGTNIGENVIVVELIDNGNLITITGSKRATIVGGK